MKKSILLSAILLTSNLLTAQWIKQNPYWWNQGSLQDVYFVDQYHGWVIGGWPGQGTTNGGSTWEPFYIGEDINGVHFTDQFQGWAVGDNGEIWHCEDGGIGWYASWESQQSGTDYNLESVFFIDSLTGWAAGWEDGYITWPYDIILSTTDGGTTWENQYQGHSGGLNAIHFVNDTSGWVAGWGGILFTNNGGNTWSQIYLNGGENIQSVIFMDLQHGWITGGYETGFISFSSDGGMTWEQQLSDSIPVLRDITFVNSMTGWAVGDSGTILYTPDGGVTWEYQESGTIQSLNSVSFSDSDHGWICGDSSILLHTDNGGLVGTGHPSVKGPGLQVQVYPNPFSDKVNVEFELNEPSNVSIQLMNSLGNIIWTTEFGRQPSGKHTKHLDIRHLASGIYFCKIQAGDQTVVKRLVKL